MVKNLLNLFFPRVCEACYQTLDDNELILCVSCRHQLPVTNFHLDHSNEALKVLYGRVKLNNATALFHFAKQGLVQQLMHNLKYRGHEQISTCFGQWLGEELKHIASYKDIDVVVPVPLHKKKLRQRGYNQVEKFGKEIAHALQIPYNDDVLVKVKSTKTQVFKERLKRWNNNEGSFKITNTTALKHKHVLIVDDIITTGATIEKCITALSDIEGITFSLATMAITD